MLTDTKTPKSLQTTTSSEVTSPLGNHNSSGNTLSMRDVKDKRSKLESKKEHKYEEAIDRCIKNMTENRAIQSIEILEQLILDKNFRSVHDFQGVGNKLNWQYQFKGPSQWWKKQTIQKVQCRNPFDLLSICFMIETFHKNISMELCLQYYEEFAERIGDLGQVLLGMGNILFNSGKFYKAEQKYIEALEKSSLEKGYEYLSWIKAFKFSDDDLAMQYCKKCLQINSYNIIARLLSAYLFKDEFRRKVFLRALSMQYPEYALVYVFLFFSSDSSCQSETYADSIQKYDPNPISGLLFKIIGFISDEKYQVAEKMLKSAIEIDPNQSEVYYVSGFLEEKKGNIHSAILYYVNCWKKDSHNLSALKNLGKLLEKIGNENSMSVYEHYIELNPYDTEVLQSLAAIYSKLKEYQKAYDCYQKALKLKPKCFVIFFKLGINRSDVKDYYLAIKYFLQAHQVNTWDQQTIYRLALCYQKLNNLDKAEMWARQCLHSQFKQAYLILAQIQLKKQQYSSALTSYLSFCKQTKAIRTKQIVSQFCQKHQKQKLPKIIFSFKEKFKLCEQNVWILLQITYILFELDENQSALNYCSELKKFKAENVLVDSQINNEFTKLIGDQIHGILGHENNIQIEHLKNQFQQSFFKYLSDHH